MCNRNTSLTDPTADFVLSDLLTVTEDLIDFSINIFDTIRLQSHFNDRNRRVNLAIQLKDAIDAQKIDISTKSCTIKTTLKYDLALYLDRILQACKRTKTNLMLLRVSRIRSTNTTLLLVASTNVRVEQLNKKIQLLTNLIKENGGQIQIKKKKKKTNLSNIKFNKNIQSKTENKQSLNLISKEDLNDYVEITLSFRTIIAKYYEFIQHIRNASKSINGQASVTNSIVLIPIAANAINELNNILNRLIRIAFTIEAESNSLRQSPIVSISNDNKEFYRQDIKDYNKEDISQQYLSRLNLKQNEIQSNIRNQSAISKTSNINSFKLTSNMIANIFEDFFF